MNNPMGLFYAPLADDCQQPEASGIWHNAQFQQFYKRFICSI
jgi:hypothetical protein